MISKSFIFLKKKTMSVWILKTILWGNEKKDGLTSSSKVRLLLPFWYFCFLLGDNAKLALSTRRKEKYKYQNGSRSINRKLRVFFLKYPLFCSFQRNSTAEKLDGGGARSVRITRPGVADGTRYRGVHFCKAYARKLFTRRYLEGLR
jgi:hypothetical protein